jgi:hypothetical protein
MTKLKSPKSILKNKNSKIIKLHILNNGDYFTVTKMEKDYFNI